MPCTDDGRSYENPETVKRADFLAQMLCKICAILESKKLLKIMPRDVRDWWTDHKKADAVRKAQEEAGRRAEAKEAKLIQTARSKLTPEELRALLDKK